MVWAHGLLRCEVFEEDKTLNSKLKNVLKESEDVVADRGYTNVTALTSNTEPASMKKLNSQFRARHETCIGD